MSKRGSGLGMEGSEHGGAGSAGLWVLSLGSTALGSAALGQTIRFDEPEIFREGEYAGYLTTADFDGDSDVDVAIKTANGVEILFNDGAGRLTSKTTIELGWTIYNMTSADMDGDGDEDLVYLEQLEDRSQFAISVWYNDGSGLSGDVVQVATDGFSRHPLIAVDFTGDGLVDVIRDDYGRTLTIYVAKPGRLFEQTHLYSHPSADFGLTGVTSGDFDEDGDVDFAATFQYAYWNYQFDVKETEVHLLINEDGQMLQRAHSLPLPSWNTEDISGRVMCSGDVDGDGDLDVVLGGEVRRDHYVGITSFLRNNDGSSLELVSTFRSAQYSRDDMMLQDIDTDGRLDVVFVNDWARGVYVLQNLGNFVFHGINPFYSSTEGSGVDSADLNGDGQFELMHAGDNGLAILSNITRLTGPALLVSELVRGEDATFVVTGAHSGEQVHFVYGLDGVGPTRGFGQLGGMTLDVLGPQAILGTSQADANGRAVLRRPIPDNAPLVPVSVQAVVRRGNGGRQSVKTPFQSVLIEE